MIKKHTQDKSAGAESDKLKLKLPACNTLSSPLLPTLAPVLTEASIVRADNDIMISKTSVREGELTLGSPVEFVWEERRR